MTNIFQQQFQETLFEHISNVMEFVKDQVIQSYIDQGHKLTGALEEEAKIEIIKIANGVIGILWLNDYYKVLDTGVEADRIPFEPNSGAGSSKYINGLIEYFKLRRNLNDTEAKSAAFATAYKHKAEGMPTKSSSIFSKTGKRTGFFTDTINDNRKEILEGVEDIFALAMNSIIGKMNVEMKSKVNIIL